MIYDAESHAVTNILVVLLVVALAVVMVLFAVLVHDK